MTERRCHERAYPAFHVTHIHGDDARCLCLTTDLSLEGMQVTRLGDDWGAPRHAWLRFWLPGDAEPIQALGELMHETVDGRGRPVRGYRFKYLNPKARRRLEAFVGHLNTELLAAG